MTQQNSLDLQGNFQSHPFAVLLAEIAAAKLTGSLRVSRHDQKAVVYFEEGLLIFAVSNSRRFRLCDRLLRDNKIDGGKLAGTPNFRNDIEFSEELKQTGVLTEKEIRLAFTQQIDQILRDLLTWDLGEWVFSALARLRSGIRVEIDVFAVLIQYARELTDKEATAHFRTLNESFELRRPPLPEHLLELSEAFVLSRITETPQKIAEILAVSGLSESNALKTLCSLWLGGLLARKDWNPAFTEIKIDAIRSANLTLKKRAAEPIRVRADGETKPPEAVKEEQKPPQIAPISIDQYLERAEKAETHYEILGISSDSRLPVIRASYFSLAKMFHPDRFHRAEPLVLRRIENAFTKLAQAHETLRNPDSRQAYDNRMLIEIGSKNRRDASGNAEGVSANFLNAERAVQEFEHGRSLLMEDEIEAALPFLARAVHLAPENARYHAFYGKALSADGQNRHKAESEMQTAIRLEPANAAFRMMLAEFFISVNLTKRAEGELNRLLGAAPDHKEAQSLLDSLMQK